MKRHYYKGKERNHSPVGCEHENLRPDLFPVREAMLETLFLRSYILSHMLQDKTIIFSRTPLLQTLALMDAKASPNPPLRPPPPWVCSITRVYCIRQFGSLRDDGTTGSSIEKIYCHIYM